MKTTVLAFSRRCITSSGVADFAVRCSTAPATACTWPNAPNSTLVNERFIALHMMIDRIRPDDPSSAPAVISSLFSSTNPIATADRPAYAFSSEMTVGISAPPIGRTSRTPKRSDSTITIGNSHGVAGRNTSTIATTIATPSRPRLITFWLR